MFNRLIKFRAWDKEENKMLHWNVDNYEDILRAIPLDAGDEWTERCELMQATGINDVDGNMIYEGDIIQYKGRKGFVIFFGGSFLIEYPEQDDDELCYMTLVDIKVIGNIFENRDW